MAGKPNYKEFVKCAIALNKTLAERTLAFLYFRSKFMNGKGTLQELTSDFEIAGLGRPKVTRLRTVLIRDRRTKRVGNDTWMIPTDRFDAIEIELHLSDCLGNMVGNKTATISIKKQKNRDSGLFVDPVRFKELKKISHNKFDLSRLLRMCEELNSNFSSRNYISVIILIRTILNHVAPILSFSNFTEVANNYKCEKSIKETFQHLENSSRKIADGYLHIQARSKEILPTLTQVNFSQDLDVLLGEIVRILK